MRKSAANQLSLFDLPAWPSPAAFAPIHIEPFGKIYALIETLGVISLHQTMTEAELALTAELQRRKRKLSRKLKPKAEP